jgi:hypothetical protein
MGKEPKMEATQAVPLDLEGLTPEQAAAALKRHNPRLTESTEMLAETIRRVRSGVKPLEGDAIDHIRQLLVKSE